MNKPQNKKEPPSLIFKLLFFFGEELSANVIMMCESYTYVVLVVVVVVNVTRWESQTAPYSGTLTLTQRA